MNYPVTLCHYGKDRFPGYSNQPDFPHLPGGLWLSDGSWRNVILESIRNRKKGWHYRHLKFVTKFIVQPSEHNEILVIKNEPGMHQFADRYGEATSAGCQQNVECNHNHSTSCFNCFGLHIEWVRVRDDYDGVAITPLQRSLSHRCGDEKFHWYRFDCASWCLWNEECFSQEGQSIPTGLDCNCLTEDSYCLGQNP